jgi:hypothetical protein
MFASNDLAAPPVNAAPTTEDLMCTCGHNHFWHEGLTGGFCMDGNCPCDVFVERKEPQ